MKGENYIKYRYYLLTVAVLLVLSLVLVSCKTTAAPAEEATTAAEEAEEEAVPAEEVELVWTEWWDSEMGRGFYGRIDLHV